MRRKYLAAAVALVIAAGMMFGGAWAQDQENRDLFSVYLQCRDRGDEAGMAAALDAMEDAGEYLYAFRGIAESEEPDVPRLAALYDRLTEPGYIALNRSEFRHINESGRLEYYNLYIGALLEKLLGMEDEEAAALAARIADNIVAECRPIIEEGRQRSRPYTALGELKSRAGALWTDELQEL